MKEYQIKALERIYVTEIRDALEILQPSMTTILDYQIDRLIKGIEIETHRAGGKDETVQLWKNTLKHLQAARALYPMTTHICQVCEEVKE